MTVSLSLKSEALSVLTCRVNSAEKTAIISAVKIGLSVGFLVKYIVRVKQT